LKAGYVGDQFEQLPRLNDVNAFEILSQNTQEILPGIEIVMNELRKLRMSADFFANTSHDISRCPGV
jgi:hypothetical protein